MPRDAWRIASATAIGTSHLNTGTVCQDSVLHKVLSTLSGDVLVVVVSDGAGSALYSDVGSRAATETLVESVEIALAANKEVSEFTREIALEWLQAINVRLNEIATANEHIVRDYACTLLAAIVAPNVAAYLQIGDGAIVVSESEADGWSYIFWPQHGEYANSTNFVVSPDAAETMAFEVGPGRVNEVAIFSDGLENLVLHNATKTVHEAFFSAMFPPVRASLVMGLDLQLSTGLEKYLSSPAICERTDDDKTLILASRAPRDQLG